MPDEWLVIGCALLASSAQVAAAQDPRPRDAETCSASWTLEETHRIGSLDGDQALSGVLDLDVGPDGDVYVAQVFTPYVTVFSPDGELLRTIGRAGGGPGEFRGWPVRLGWFQDTLWVTDRRATQLFDSDGREARRIEFRHGLRAEGSEFIPGAPLADGTFLARRVITWNAGAFFTVDSLSVPRFDPDGEIVGVIVRIPQPLLVSISDRGYAWHPLSGWGGPGWGGITGAAVQVTTDGRALLFVGDVETESPATFDLVKLGIDGDTLMIRGVPFDPRPVSSSDEDWLREGFAARMAGDYRSTPSALHGEATRERRRQEAAAAIDFPRYHPPVRNIVAGGDGTIWVLRELVLPDRTDVWQVYGPDGVLEGTIRVREGQSDRLPWSPRLRVFRADRTEVWGTTIDELDVPYIHRFAVRRGCS